MAASTHPEHVALLTDTSSAADFDVLSLATSSSSSFSLCLSSQPSSPAFSRGSSPRTSSPRSADSPAPLELLAPPPPACAQTALNRLLDRARRPSWRVWAEGAPFERKDLLKARGYRWSSGEDGRPRGWWIDLAEAALEAEIAVLRDQVYGAEVQPLTRRVTAYDRYSERV